MIRLSSPQGKRIVALSGRATASAVARELGCDRTEVLRIWREARKRGLLPASTQAKPPPASVKAPDVDVTTTEPAVPPRSPAIAPAAEPPSPPPAPVMKLRPKPGKTGQFSLDEQKAILALHGQMKARQVALQFGCTRNAIIGIWDRAIRRGELVPLPPPPKRQKPTVAELARISIVEVAPATPDLTEAAPIAAIVTEVSSDGGDLDEAETERSVKFIDAGPLDCRWPLWGPSARTGDICGARVVEGQSYCAWHCRRSTWQRPHKQADPPQSDVCRWPPVPTCLVDEED